MQTNEKCHFLSTNFKEMQIKVTDLQHVVDRLERQLELNEKELVDLRQSKDELGAELGEATEDAKNNEGQIVILNR